MKRIDHVKTWYQKIHSKGLASVKIIMNERPGSFIDSGGKRLMLLLYYSVPREV